MIVLDDLSRDLQYALRLLRRSPGFAVVAVLTLALGIGATTAIFSVINTVLLAPLPYPNADRIVRLVLKSQGGSAPSLAVPEFMSMRTASKTLEGFCLYDFGGTGINLTGGDRPEQVRGIRASANYFQLFGAPVELGRTFSTEEDRPNGPHVVVISNGLWRSRYGADRGIVGRAIALSGDPYVVIGVLGRDFKPDPPADLWLPVQADPNSTDFAHYLLGAAMLRPGARLAQADTELKLATAEYERRFPAAGFAQGGTSFAAEPMLQAQVANIKPALLTLLGAVGFVLLIACSNVANLLLARAMLRKREIAIRAALGAGRRRIISQLLTESVLLSVAGGALGLVVGWIGVRALLAVNPGNIPRIGEHGTAVTLDWRVLVFTLLVAALTGILFGLIPAVTASRADLSSTLKESGSRAGTGLRHNRVRAILVVSEMSLAVVLLIGAGLLIRTFAALRSVNPGFDAHDVLIMQMSLSGVHFEKTEQVAQMERQAEQSLERLPGVVAAATTCSPPLGGSYGLPFDLPGRKPANNGQPTGGAEWVFVSPHFFDVFRIPLIRGRFFTDQDMASAPHVVIINEALAKQYWKSENPVGQQMIVGKETGPEFAELPREIVGVVGDVRDAGLSNDPPAIMYMPAAQLNDGVTALVNRLGAIFWTVRTRVAPFSLSRAIQDRLRDASGGLPVAHIESMEQIVGESTAQNTFNMTLLTIFAGIALLLAAVGVYGLMAYTVQQRTQEIGIRMALGASPQRVRAMVVRQGMVFSLAGIVIGVGAAVGLTRLIAAMLYGVKPWDPAIFIVVAAVLGGISWVAVFIPARRAAQVDPVSAIRCE